MLQRSTPAVAGGTAATAAPARPELIGDHPLVEQVRALVSRVASTGVTVLVQGESGTGKEVAARMIHAASDRANQPFVAVNCGAIPPELLESEMFGHERGSFTGALSSRAGMFQLAHQGTIFLDEIGEMSAALQVKLLRVLQEREVRPLGSDRTLKIDVRVIAATNKDLEKEVQAGRFREDLYYRLNVVPVSMPPLRERRSDIPVLVEHFLLRMESRFPGRHWTVSQAAMVSLWSYDWPGNVRELENMIERLVIMCEGDVIEADLLPPTMVATPRAAQNHVPAPLAEGGINLNAMVRELEGRMINEALRHTGGNKQAAARLLGLKRTTFSAKLRRCGVIAPAGSGWYEET
jgi:DNA-binding NtrC family response regulator